MILAAILGLMAAGAVIALAWPLLRPRADARTRASYDSAIWRDQLAEIARDQDRGLIGTSEAAAARAEIERRALVSLDSDQAAPPAGRSRAGRVVAVTLIVALPALAGIIYLALGQPQLPGQPFAARPKAPAATAGAPKMPSPEALATMAQAIEARLAESPGEVQGWTLLIRLYRRLGRPDAADAAYRKILAAGTDPAKRADAALGYGEALLTLENGMITPAAREAFDEALKLRPADPAARFYRGLALAQGGDRTGALAVWQELERTAPADAPWREALTSNIARLKREAVEAR